MHDSLGSRAKPGANLDRPHKSPLNDFRGQHEVVVNVGAVGLERERLGRLHDQVRRAELPAVCELGRGRDLGLGALGSALRDPIGNLADLLRGETVLIGEVAVAGLGQPGRHVMALGNGYNLAGVLLNVLKGEQRERAGLAGPVAGGAVLVNDRRDVVSEGERLSGSDGRRWTLGEKEKRTRANGRQQQRGKART